jgi:hypothetical protein
MVPCQRCPPPSSTVAVRRPAGGFRSALAHDVACGPQPDRSGARPHRRWWVVARLLLLIVGPCACQRTSPPTITPSASSATTPDRVTLTTPYEAQIVQHIVQFETTLGESPALAAALELGEPDPFAPPNVDSIHREESRRRRVVLWGRLFCALDAELDWSFDVDAPPPTTVELDSADVPEGVPHVTLDAVTDPILHEKYRARQESLQQQMTRYALQVRLHRIHRRIVERAQDFFRSTFVRSLRSLAIVDDCADAGHWAPARRQQVRAWVAPIL